jgi:hypothetical protein
MFSGLDKDRHTDGWRDLAFLITRQRITNRGKSSVENNLSVGCGGSQRLYLPINDTGFAESSLDRITLPQMICGCLCSGVSHVGVDRARFPRWIRKWIPVLPSPGLIDNCRIFVVPRQQHFSVSSQFMTIE